jgi:DNA transformation protein
MIGEAERAKLLAVPLCGERVIERLAAIGVTRLADLRGRDPEELVRQVNESAGYVIWRPPMATWAMANLVAAADREAAGRDKPASGSDGATAEGEPGAGSEPLPERLEDLVNVGPKLAEWLRAAGIATPSDLDAVGSVAAYRRIKAAFPERVTLLALDALEGALLGVNGLYLPVEIKDRLRAEVGSPEVEATNRARPRHQSWRRGKRSGWTRG